MVKITQLPSLTVPGSNDELAIVDNAGVITKRITRSNLLKGAPFPADTVDTQSIVDNSVTNAKLALGTPVQMIDNSSTAVATGTTLVPVDDTVPQNTEGTEFLTISITPKSSTNILVVEFYSFVTTNGANNIIGAVFRDSTANAIGVGMARDNQGSAPIPLVTRARAVAGSTSATTFKLRIGPQASGTVSFNGIGGSRYFGATIKSTAVITEYKAV